MNINLTPRNAPALINPAQPNFKALIRRSIDLRRLYGYAAAASEPGLRVVLSDNARTLDLLIGDLQTQLRGIGLKPPVRGSVRGSAHRHIAGWMMHASPRSGLAWIRLLGHREGVLLHAFERALADASPELALSLRRQLPRLHGIHLDMDNLAGTTR